MQCFCVNVRIDGIFVAFLHEAEEAGEHAQ